MRQIGVLSSEQEARRFAAYLMTLGVAAHAEPQPAEPQHADAQHAENTGDQSRDAITGIPKDAANARGAAIWVRDENHLDQAREELARFRENPADSRYQGAEREAAGIQRERERKRDQSRKNIVEMSGRWGRPQPRRQPLTMVILGLMIVVALLTSMGENRDGVAMKALLFKDPSAASGARTPGTPIDTDAVSYRMSDILRGEVWRLITPIFVHYGPLHLIFNAIMMYQFGAILEPKLGTPKFALLVLITGIASIGSQSLAPAAWEGSTGVGGISGVVFGLVGYMWMKTAFDPAMGIYLPMSTVFILGIWMFLGFFGILKNHFGIPVANWAHGVGLVSGMILAFAPPLGKMPRR
jgi:GlpG protein